MSTEETVRLSIFDIRVFSNLREAAGAMVNEDGPRARFALAVNPEKVMIAEQSSEATDLLATADFCYPDGIGVVWAMKRKGARRTRRIPGAELWLELVMRCANYGHPIYLIGARDEVLERTVHKLQSEYPSLNVAGHHSGYFDEAEEIDLIDEVSRSGARCVFVAMGSPRQERFIRKAKEQAESTLFMGVGGSYDVYIGEVRRAPAIFRKLGLEWFFRLLSQPSRWRRQLALLQFVSDVYRKKL